MALRLNSPAEFVYRNTNLIQANSDYTISFWARVTVTPPGTDFVSLFFFGDGSGASTEIFTDQGDADKFTLAVSDGVSFLYTPGSTFRLNTYLPFAYVRSGNDHKFYCDGVLVGTVTLDISAITFTGINLGYDGGSISNINYFDIREWNTALTLDELLAEWKSTTPVKSANGWSNLPFLSDLVDTINGYDFSASGSVDFIGSPVLRNLRASVATEVAAPSTGSYNANNNDNTETFSLFFTVDAPIGSDSLGIFGFGGALNSGYQPLTIVSNVTVTIGDVTSPPNKPLQFQITPGDTYHFEVRKLINNNPATLTLNVYVHTPSTIPAGSIGVNDDTEGFPLAILSFTTDYEVKAFKNNFAAGEAGDILDDGTLLLENVDTLRLYLYDTDLNEITNFAGPGVGARIIRTCQGLQCFFAISQQSSPQPMHKIDNTGATLETYSVASGLPNINGAAVNNDGTILYVTRGTANAPIKQYDLVNNVLLADLAPGFGATFLVGDILVQRDGSIIVIYLDGSLTSGPVTIVRYASNGTILNTYDRTTFTGSGLGGCRLAYSIDGDETFLFWGHATLTVDGISHFQQIRCSDGVTLVDRLHMSYETGQYLGVQANPPVANFGMSMSCPFWQFRGTGPVVVPGVLILTPGRRRDVDTKIPTPFFETYFTGG